MPKAFSFTESQLDAIVGALETEISAVHNETLGEDAELGLDDVPLTEEDVADASRLLVTLLRTLEKIDPEHPLALDFPKPGTAYDFDAALDGEDDDDDDEDEDLAAQYRPTKKPSKVVAGDVVEGSFVKGRTETNATRAAGS